MVLSLWKPQLVLYVLQKYKNKLCPIYLYRKEKYIMWLGTILGEMQVPDQCLEIGTTSKYMGYGSFEVYSLAYGFAQIQRAKLFSAFVEY